MKSVKVISLSTAVVGVLLMSGCASQPKPLYSYSDYSQCYYDSKKELTKDSALALQESIKRAIEDKENCRSGRVAPGMYANLGYIYLKEGKTKEAISSFEKEKAIYPESAHFMDRMIKKIKTSEKGDS